MSNQNSNSNNNIWKKVAIGAGIAGGVLLGVGLIPMALGFGVGGIAAGSVAAGIQSIIGNVAAGSLFAACTSLGMTGVFASSAAVGAILGAGGLAAYIKSRFSADDDSKLIHATIENNDNPDIIIKLLEARYPQERKQIKIQYNEYQSYGNFNEDIINFVPLNCRDHVNNLLIDTNDIIARSDEVKDDLNNQPFGEYFRHELDPYKDAKLIKDVINNKDEPLIIVRLLNYRDKEQRKEIEKKFQEIVTNEGISMLSYILNYMPGHPEVIYLHNLLD